MTLPIFVLSKVKLHWNLLKHTDFKITGSGCYLKKKEKKKTIEICVMSYLCGERRIALVNLPQSVEHFGQLWWIHWLHCDLDDWCCVELQRPKNLSLKGRVKKNMRIWIWLFFYFSKTLGIFFCRSPTSSFPLGSVIVAVLTIGWSQPSMRTQLPAGTRFTSIWYLK